MLKLFHFSSISSNTFPARKFPAWKIFQRGKFAEMSNRRCHLSYMVQFLILNVQGRQSGLKSVGAQRGGNFGVFLPQNRENYEVAVFTYHKWKKSPTFGVDLGPENLLSSPK